MEPTNTTPTQPVMPPVAPVTPPPTVPPVMPPTSAPAPEHKPIGPIIGVVIILILLVAAAIYVWGQKLNNDKKMEVQPAAVQPTEKVTAKDSTDSFSDLEAGVNSSVEGLDDLNF